MNTNYKTATDFRRDLESQLKNIAKVKNTDLQRLRRKVAFDRFLARLFSQNEPKFFLKGGYAMELRLSTARATKDIDLTCLERSKGKNDPISLVILDELRELTRTNLNDFFVYQIGEPQIDMENAPYGGARYPITSLIDGKVFVKFQLDVGADAVVAKTETFQGADWLSFCGIPCPTFTMISIEQQYAEKLHAYTVPRPQRINTRTKDLVDMVLLARMRAFDLSTLKEALRQVFKVRSTHTLPLTLNPPPSEWQLPFDKLARECALPLGLDDAFNETANIYNKVRLRFGDQ
jgi:predicted nucleotidyltransferase component of viral defense system